MIVDSACHWRSLERHAIAQPENTNGDAKIFIENDKSQPQGIIAVKTTEKGTPKVIVPIKYQKSLIQRTHLKL